MTLLGIFVGGASSRMGRPKGGLSAPGGDETLIERLVRVGREAGLDCVLVGDATPYAELAKDVPRLADDPAGVGPLGGLSALLAFAGTRDVVTVACDMPRVSPDVLRQLRDAQSDQPVVAARDPQTGRWQSFCARWRPASVRPVLRDALADGERSFQALLSRLEVDQLVLADDHTLVDWDAPEDVE